MIWKQLSIRQFKGFNSLELNLFPGINCFVGDNGMGKTNILDAIYYLSMTKSNFLRQDKDVVKHGERWFRIEGRFQHFDKENKLEVKYQIESQKVFILNDKKYQKLSQHIGTIPTVLISPDDIQQLLDGSHEGENFWIKVFHN